MRIGQRHQRCARDTRGERGSDRRDVRCGGRAPTAAAVAPWRSAGARCGCRAFRSRPAARHSGKAGRQEIDRRRAEPARDVTIARVFVDLARRADLDQRAVPDHADAGGHRHGLDLIVGHVEDRRAELDAGSASAPAAVRRAAWRRARTAARPSGRSPGRAPARARSRRAAFRRRKAASPGCRACCDVQQLRRLLDALADRRLPARGAPASAAERQDCRRRSGADTANIAGRQTRCPASAGGSPVTSRPSIKTMPASGRSRPATSRSVVVLPAPLGPSSTMNSPSLMVKRSRARRRRGRNAC